MKNSRSPTSASSLASANLRVRGAAPRRAVAERRASTLVTKSGEAASRGRSTGRRD